MVGVEHWIMFSMSDFGEMSSMNTFIYMSTRPVKNLIKDSKNSSILGIRRDLMRR